MAAARNYSSVARLTTLTSSVNGSVNVFAVTDTTGYPTAPFTMVADPGRSNEEIVTVTNVVGLNLTVIRGEDGSSAQPHDAGADLRHMATARDFREAGVHVGATSGVHGVSGALVGSSDTQVLDNKTFTASLTDHTAIRVKQAASQGSPLLVFSDSSNATLATVTSTGRITTPGIDGSVSTVLQTSDPSTVPLIVKGAPVQTARLQSWRDSSSTELSFIEPTGVLNAPGINVGVVDTPQINVALANVTSLRSNGQAQFTTATSTDTPLTVKTPPTHSGYSLVVRDSSNAVQAGITGDAGDFRFFQSGGDYVPWKIHCGKKTVTMGSGTSSISSSVDISSYGFTANPLVMFTVQQFEESTLKRRVCVNSNGITTGSIAFRVVQTANELMPDNTNYDVHWMAMQMSPDGAAG
jgi:hypothetical protein